MNEQKVALYQYEIDAVDLSLIGLDIDNFEVGNGHPVINPVMNIDERLRIVAKTTDINNPQESSLKIGDKFKTLDEYQHDANKSARQVVELEGIVSSQSQRIGQLLSQINNVNNEIDNVKQIIDNSDLEELPEAINSLEQAIQDLNDALDDIPIYDVATPTQDGQMSAADKAKLDLIQVINSIDLDSLKAKLDLITVTQAINLDDLEARVTALENGP